MKVETTESFSPIHVVLETKGEAQLLVDILGYDDTIPDLLTNYDNYERKTVKSFLQQVRDAVKKELK